MIAETYDFAVIGDELAGVWLLTRLAELRTLSKDSPQKLLWLRGSNKKLSWLLPKVAYEVLPFSEKFSHWGKTENFELVSPERTVVWTPEGVGALYPTLMKVDVFQPNASIQSSIRYTLTHQPKLLTQASAIWKAVGRAPKLTAEAEIWAALLSMELKTWSPNIEKLKDQGVTIGGWPGEIKKVSRRKDKMTELAGDTVVAACRWLINMEREALFRLFPVTELRQRVSALHTAPESRLCHYKTTVVSSPVPLFSEKRNLIRLDSEEIPDPEREIWPIFANIIGDKNTFEIWSTGVSELSIESQADLFRKGLGRLLETIPGLEKRIESIEPVLDPDACLNEEKRKGLDYQNRRIDLFERSQIEMRTPTPFVYHVSPAFKAHLPYPLGPLVGAKQVLNDFLKKAVALQRSATT